MKRTLLFIITLAATINVNAQFKPGHWSFQPMIGIGLSSMTNEEDIQISGSDKLEKQMAAAALLGGEFEYQITDKVSLATGLNYSIQGQQWQNAKVKGVKYEQPRIELGYIKIPVVANYYFAKGWAVKAGLQFGIMTDANIRVKAEGNTDILGTSRKATIDTTIDLKPDCEKVDVSIPLGISYQFKNPWVLDLRYQLGLTNINKSGDSDTKNSVFMLTCGYKFTL